MIQTIKIGIPTEASSISAGLSFLWFINVSRSVQNTLRGYPDDLLTTFSFRKIFMETHYEIAQVLALHGFRNWYECEPKQNVSYQLSLAQLFILSFLWQCLTSKFSVLQKDVLFWFEFWKGKWKGNATWHQQKDSSINLNLNASQQWTMASHQIGRNHHKNLCLYYLHQRVRRNFSYTYCLPKSNLHFVKDACSCNLFSGTTVFQLKEANNWYISEVQTSS